MYVHTYDTYVRVSYIEWRRENLGKREGRKKATGGVGEQV